MTHDELDEIIRRDMPGWKLGAATDEELEAMEGDLLVQVVPTEGDMPSLHTAVVADGKVVGAQG